MLPCSEAELVGRAQAGDPKAFDELVSLHQERVYALAYRLLGSADDAADAQQDTFVQAWRNLRRFRCEAAFSTWLHRITVNLCVSRKRRKNVPVLMEGIENSLSWSSNPNAALSVEISETAAAVRRVLDAMPPHYRALLVLRDMEERPFEEIARILGCSVDSARSRLCRARRLLREKMRPYLGGDDE